MRLTQSVIDVLNTPEHRPDFQKELKKSESTILRLFKENKENGPLTSAGALELIRTKTGMSDAEILESIPVLQSS